MGDSGDAVGVSEERPVGSEAAGWGEATAPLSLGSPAPLPSPSRSAPLLGLQRSRTGGDGMGRCERRGVVARCTPGLVVRARDPAGGGGQEQATELAGERDLPLR